MKSFSDKTNTLWNKPRKTVCRMNLHLLFLLIGALSILGSTRAYSQQSKIIISGIVKNSHGETIIGANILEKGTNNGTITNIDGLFTLHVSPNAVLKVSYIGYTEQEVSIRNKNKLEIIMAEDTKLIDEVVVVGYGSVKKRDLTGAVTSIKSEEVLATPTNNVMEALQGKIPGMDITKTSGQIGDDVTILLRGSRSIYGSNEPLFIIDGIPGSYSQVSPSDIESVDENFDLSVFAMARYGQTINSDLLGYYTAKQSVTQNQLAGVNYWTENNQSAYFPRPGTADEQKAVYPSLRVRDGSFIKIKNITLGYTLPVDLSRKVLMEKCRIYATAYNPFIFVKDKQLKDTDPETNGSDAFPTYRQFIFGVNITF